MTRFFAAALSLIIATALGAQEKKESDTHLDKDNGFLIKKPAKNENWAFKNDAKKLTNSLCSLQHRIDDLAIEVFFQKQDKKAPLDLDTKKTATDEVKGQEEQKTKGEYKEMKTKESPKEVNFPGDGSPKAYYFKLAIKDKNDREFEWHEWVFISKANKGQYRVFIMCAPGEYDKKKKEVDGILATFTSFAVK